MMERKIELIQKIIALAIKLNAETKMDVFFDYSGHVEKFEVVLYPDGWVNGNAIRYGCWSELFYDGSHRLEEILKALELIVLKEVA